MSHAVGVAEKFCVHYSAPLASGPVAVPLSEAREGVSANNTKFKYTH
jgi:hypothetical protein